MCKLYNVEYKLYNVEYIRNILFLIKIQINCYMTTSVLIYLSYKILILFKFFWFFLMKFFLFFIVLDFNWFGSRWIYAVGFKGNWKWTFCPLFNKNLQEDGFSDSQYFKSGKLIFIFRITICNSKDSIEHNI